MLEGRATFTDDEFAAVMRHFDIGPVEHRQDFPRGSHESAKMMIRTDRGKFLLKRRPRGKDEPMRVAFSHELQNYLAEQGFPLPHLVGTQRTNHSMLRHADAIYELYEFIPGEGFDHTPASAAESGRMLAVFHRIVARFHSQFRAPEGSYHDAARTRTLLTRIGERLPESPAAPSAAGQVAAVAQLVNRLRAAYDIAANDANAGGVLTWETQIVHSDWHPGNLLFHQQRIVAVLDYDSSRILPPATDVANGALQFSLRTGGRDPTQWNADCDMDRFRAFLSGYDATRRITSAELAVLPALMIEALISEAVGPIAAAGHFARLDGFAFLRTILRKVLWLRENAHALSTAVV